MYFASLSVIKQILITAVSVEPLCCGIPVAMCVGNKEFTEQCFGIWMFGNKKPDHDFDAKYFNSTNQLPSVRFPKQYLTSKIIARPVY
jgi:hypothetical protein